MVKLATLEIIKQNLNNDSELEEFLKSRSNLYTSYSVRDNDGHFRSVIDISSVIELLKEII